MFKRIAITTALLAGLVAFAAPRQANAEVRFGVSVGVPAPVYSYPAYPAYGYDPYADYYNTPAPVYSYPAPVYVAPSYGYYNRGWRGYDRHEWRERERHERHEFREHRGFRR